MRLFLIVLLCGIILALSVTVVLENGYGHAWAIAFSPDGQQLAVAYNNTTTWVWDMSRERAEPGRMTLASDSTHWVSPRVQFGGPRLLVAFRKSRSEDAPDGYELWDTVAKRRLRVIRFPYQVQEFHVSAESDVILASPKDAHALDLFDLESGKYLGSLDESENESEDENESDMGHSRPPRIMSASGERVVTSSDEAVHKVWDIKSRQCVGSLLIKNGYGSEISHDGRFLADRNQDIWNLETGDKVVSIDGGPYALGATALSADGKMLAGSSFYSGQVKVWDTTNGRLLAKFLGAASSPMDASRRTYIAFSPDGKWMATATNRTVKLWDTADFRSKRTLTRGYRLLAAVVCSVAFIVWSVVWGVSWRRWNRRSTESNPNGPKLVLPSSILFGVTGLIAIANSTFDVLHPGLCSCCTPTLLLLAFGYLGLGTGLFVLAQTIGQEPESLIPATLMLVVFNSPTNMVLFLIILICGGMAVLLQVTAAIAMRKP